VNDDRRLFKKKRLVPSCSFCPARHRSLESDEVEGEPRKTAAIFRRRPTDFAMSRRNGRQSARGKPFTQPNIGRDRPTRRIAYEVRPIAFDFSLGDPNSGPFARPCCRTHASPLARIVRPADGRRFETARIAIGFRFGSHISSADAEPLAPGTVRRRTSATADQKTGLACGSRISRFRAPAKARLLRK
jgi:hypothetical protein